MRRRELLKLDKAADACLESADRKISVGDMTGAIVMLRNALEKSPDNPEIIMRLADAYGDISQNELAINMWYKYLSVCKKKDVSNAYGGLSLNYYCLNKQMIAAHYTNLQMQSCGFADLTGATLSDDADFDLDDEIEDLDDIDETEEIDDRFEGFSFVEDGNEQPQKTNSENKTDEKSNYILDELDKLLKTFSGANEEDVSSALEKLGVPLTALGTNGGLNKKSSEFRLLSDIKEEKYKKVLTDIHAAVMNSNTERALDLLDEIDENSKYYVLALNECTISYMLVNDFVNAKKYAELALSKDDSNFDALCNLATIYFATDNPRLSAEYIKKAESMANDEYGRMFRLASVFCDQDKYEKAVFWLRKINEDSPYDINILYLLGITEYNLCNFESAVDCFGKIIRLTGDKRVAGWYLDRAVAELNNPDRAKQITPLIYSFEIPVDARRDRLRTVNNALKLPPEQISEQLKKDKKLVEAAEWCLWSGENEIQKIGVFLITADLDHVDMRYIQKLLLDATLSDAVKKLILKIVVVSCYDGKLKFVYSDFYRTVQVRLPSFIYSEFSKLSVAILEAYSQAFAEVVPLESKYMAELCSRAEKLFYLFENLEKPELYVSQFAAYIAAVPAFIKEFGMETIEKRLKVSENDFQKILTMVEDAENEKNN